MNIDGEMFLDTTYTDQADPGDCSPPGWQPGLVLGASATNRTRHGFDGAIHEARFWNQTVPDDRLTNVVATAETDGFTCQGRTVVIELAELTSEFQYS